MNSQPKCKPTLNDVGAGSNPCPYGTIIIWKKPGKLLFRRGMGWTLPLHHSM